MSTPPPPAVPSRDALRERFKACRRLPQMLEVREQVRTAIRQTSDAMDVADGGDWLLIVLPVATRPILNARTGPPCGAVGSGGAGVKASCVLSNRHPDALALQRGLNANTKRSG